MPTDINTEPGVKPRGGSAKNIAIGGAPPPPADAPPFLRGEPAPDQILSVFRGSRTGEIPTARPFFGFPQKPAAPVAVSPPPKTPPTIVGGGSQTLPGGVAVPTTPQPQPPKGRFQNPLANLVFIGALSGLGEFTLRPEVFNLTFCIGLKGKEKRDCLLRRAQTAIANIAGNIFLRGFPFRIPKGTVPFVGPVPKIRPGRTTPGTAPVVVIPGGPQTSPVMPREISIPTETPIIPGRPAAPPAKLPGKIAKPASPPPAPAVPREIISPPGPLVPAAPGPVPATVTPTIAPPKPATPTKSPVIPGLGTLLDVGLAVGFAQISRALSTNRNALTSELADLVAGSTPGVGQASPFISRFAAPATSPLRQRARTSDKECVEVARARKRGKCYEGFFEQLPGRTRYTRWREVNCLTRKTIRSFS